MLDNGCIIFLATEHKEKERLAPRDETDGVGVTLDVSNNIEKAKNVRAFHRKN
ncbi:hypothetical protein MUK42_31405 [Musa troglodytarum]|uniref:Uncharacterized protein n=1 Tax=Musa troglodytarum TaxID=320322 RepID=A0A9E7FB05_9LILI|nr:hypothetical protein MUK42_31405 [Musa troglodytarum]